MTQDHSIWDRIVRRDPVHGDGKTGALVERVTLDDGRVLIAKTVTPDLDIAAAATGDDGRILRLLEHGVFDALPEPADHAMIGAERRDEGWVELMRDVTDHLLPDDGVVPLAQHRRILEAAANIHEAFRGADLPELCPLEARFIAMSPAKRDVWRHRPIGRLFLRGWEAFHDIAPADVADAVAEVHRAPARLADELRTGDTTLLHGDIRLHNVALTADRVTLLDWGTMTAVGPAEVDLSWYIAINASRADATREHLVDLYQAVARAPIHARMWQRAALGILATLGWNKALDATANPDDAVRRREHQDLQWWIKQAGFATAA